MKLFLIIKSGFLTLLVLVALLSCSKEHVQPSCAMVYDVRMIYSNDRIYLRSDTTWSDRLCGSELSKIDRGEYWVHACVDGVPSYWERFVTIVK